MRTRLTKREVENLSAGIQELDLKCVVYDWEALLPNELVHAGLANFAVAVRPRVNSVVVAGGGTVEPDLEPNRLAVLCRSQNDVQIAGVERNTTLPGTACSSAASGPTFHEPTSPHWFSDGDACAV